MITIKCKMCSSDIQMNAEDTHVTCEYCGSTMVLPKASDEKKTKVLEEKTASDTKPTTNVISVVIPKMFTDKTLEEKRKNLVGQIGSLEMSKINLEGQLDSAHFQLSSQKRAEEEYRVNQQKRKQEAEAMASLHRGNMEGLMYRGRALRLEIDMKIDYNPVSEYVQKAQQEVYSIQNKIAKEKSDLYILNRELKDLEALLRLTPAQRTEQHYRRLLDKKNTASGEKEYIELTKEFRAMEGYIDSEALAAECEAIPLKIQYNRLVDAMNKASTEDEYQDLAKQFREMKDYENTKELASQCDVAAVKARYNLLIQAKNRASTEKEYKDLAIQFRGMGGYEDTSELANECDKQYRALKERREEQEKNEREERERREEQERIEQERREEQERIEKERRAAQARKRKIIAIGATVGAILLLVLWNYLSAEIQRSTAYRQATTALSNGDFKTAANEFRALGDYKDAQTKVLEVLYAQAEAAFFKEDYQTSINEFRALGNFKDARTRVSDVIYAQAEAAFSKNDYQAAADGFRSLRDYKDAQSRLDEVLETAYAQAEAVSPKGNYEAAFVKYNELIDYMNVKERLDEAFELAIDKISGKPFPRRAISSGILSNVLSAGRLFDGGTRTHTVGLRADGTVIAVGANWEGQCNVSDWKDIVAVAANANYTIGLRANGTVVAVGYIFTSIRKVLDWKNIVAIAGWGEHIIGLYADGTVVAIGDNSEDQCNVSNWKDIVAVAAGHNNTFGLRADRMVVAVGVNHYGQCNVSDWKDIVAIATGGFHTIGLHADGTVVAVGNNIDGRCNVSDWKNIIAIAGGAGHTVGLRADGTVVAVGNNNNGQCNVSDWKDIVAIAAGGGHTLGLHADGSVVAVGYNGEGQCNVDKWYIDWRKLLVNQANRKVFIGLVDYIDTQTKESETIQDDAVMSEIDFEATGAKVSAKASAETTSMDVKAINSDASLILEDVRFIWVVKPTLSYDKISYCQYCDLFNNYNFEQRADLSISAKLNELQKLSQNGTLILCMGHGGGYPNYMYDEKKGLYGFHESDEGGQNFTMMQRSDFFLQNNPHQASILFAFQKIDSEKVKIVKGEFEWESYYDFKEAYISNKYAVAYNGVFVTDFIYDDNDLNPSPDIIAMKLNNKWGILDKYGNTLIPFEFDHITLIDENAAFAKYDGKYGILDIKKNAAKNNIKQQNNVNTVQGNPHSSAPNSKEQSNTEFRMSEAPSSAFANLLGVYHGSYFAGQGETGLTLTVFMVGKICKARFEFYNLPGKNNARSGSYYMNVTNESNGNYSFVATQWIMHPLGYDFVNLEGKLNNGILEGASIYSSGTYTFKVTKQGSLNERVSSSTKPTSTGQSATIKGNSVRIRSEPNTADNSNILHQANDGDRLTVIDKRQVNSNELWYLVEYQLGKQGWVRSDFISLK